ncbi:hybrid sensor histidine kinase/response regulator [Methylolobus aquaticus]|nr:hybrid sensor histidine kinase/response regulator [Methylolobus aquaticus]
MLRLLRRSVLPLRRRWRPHRFSAGDETAFRVFQAERIYPQARCALALGCLVWCLFTVWDIHRFPEFSRELSVIGLLWVAPVLAATWWLVATRPLAFRRGASCYLLCGPLAAVGGLALIQGVVEPAGSEQASVGVVPGLAGVVLFAQAVLGLLFIPALMLGAVSALVLLGSGSAADVSAATALGGLPVLVVANGLGMLLCVRHEFSLRLLFRLRQRARGRAVSLRSRGRKIGTAAVPAGCGLARGVLSAGGLERPSAGLTDLTDVRERLFSAAFHDLQQPLSIIGLYVRLAKGRCGRAAAGQIKADLSAIEGAAREIGAMFKEVSDAWDVGRSDPELVVVDVNRLLGEVAAELRACATGKGLRLRLRVSRRAPCLAISDRALLKRAVCNLVCNAIKYTERGGLVVGAVGAGSHVRVVVRDTGVGIPAICQTRVFDEFFRVNHPTGKRQPGLGLGLAIVRRIQEVLPDHRVSLWSRDGRGSRFTLTMPLAVAVDAGEAASRRATARAGCDALQGKYVFVVEDERLILDGLVESLRSAGCVAEGVERVATARGLLATRDRCPDALVTDYRLRDGETGVDIVAVLRERFEWATATPVVFLTGEVDWRAPPDGFDAPWEVCRKPIDPDALVRRLGELVRNQSV